MESLSKLFDASGFMPHGHCFLWTPSLLWTYVTSDGLIAAAYYSIPVAIGYFVRRRADIPYRWVFVMFGVFIFACGTTHVVALWNLWQPHYWLDAALKLFTAFASVATAVALWPLMPRALAIPSPEQLHEANTRLEEEVARRRRSDEMLHALNVELELRIAERTAELEAINQKLHEETKVSRASARALREEKERFRLVVESAPNGIVMVDHRGTIVLVNRELERVFQYAREQLIGRPVEILVPPETQSAHFVQRAAYASRPEARAMGEGRELRGRRRDGTPLHVEVGLSPLQFGEETYVLATVVDVTARREAERQLAADRALLKTLVDTLPDIVFAKDAAGKYILCNKTLLEELRVSDERELIGKTVLDLLPEDVANDMYSDDLAVLAGRPVLEREEQIEADERGPRWYITSKAPLRDRHGKIFGLVGVSRDVTQRKRTEEHQRRAQKLEALGTLASGVAHDFNNVLLAISGNARMALDDLAADHPVRESLAAIQTASARAADLVRRILAFTRQNDIARARIDVSAVIDEAVRLLRATLPAHVKLDTRYDAALPAVNADATQLLQVAMNLGTNAAHAIGGRPGSVRYLVEPVRVTEEMVPFAADLQPGIYVRLTVIDDGCGMKSETLDRIFDPFFTTKAPGEGTGLGLSVVHGIVRNHGGSITVYSVPDKGSTFKVYLPAIPGETAVAAPLPTAAARGRGERVLVVDDEQPLVDLERRMLEKLGYSVSGFSDPIAALGAFVADSHAFDLVVTDLSMPTMTGFELCTRILATRPDIPVVLTSGYVSQEDQERAERIGIRAVISKPNSIDELARALHELLRSGRDERSANTTSEDPDSSGRRPD